MVFVDLLLLPEVLYLRTFYNRSAASSFVYMCCFRFRAGALIVSGRVGYGGDREVLGGFGYRDRDDKLTVVEAGTSWMADAGDIPSANLNIETGTVFGEAIFENFDGDQVSGSFEFRCP
jgi:hypothetical protein